MQSEAERVLRNLTILGSISHNDKLNTNEETFSIYVPTVLRGLARSWYSEKRNSNLQKIQDTMRYAIQFIQNTSQDIINDTAESFAKASKEKHCKRMFQTLDKSKTGLANLKQTYRDDVTMHAQLQLIMDEIDDFISIVGANTQPQLQFLASSCSSPTTTEVSQQSDFT